MAYVQINSNDTLFLNSKSEPQKCNILPKVVTCLSKGSHVIAEGRTYRKEKLCNFRLRIVFPKSVKYSNFLTHLVVLLLTMLILSRKFMLFNLFGYILLLLLLLLLFFFFFFY